MQCQYTAHQIPEKYQLDYNFFPGKANGRECIEWKRYQDKVVFTGLQIKHALTRHAGPGWCLFGIALLDLETPVPKWGITEAFPQH